MSAFSFSVTPSISASARSPSALAALFAASPMSLAVSAACCMVFPLASVTDLIMSGRPFVILSMFSGKPESASAAAFSCDVSVSNSALADPESSSRKFTTMVSMVCLRSSTTSWTSVPRGSRTC